MRHNNNSVLLWLLFLFERSTAQLKVLSPPYLSSQLSTYAGSSGFLTGATATFGAPTYGESLAGRMYAASGNGFLCDSDAEAALKQMFEDSAPAEGLGRIAVAERGNCTFVEKARHAEAAGANAIVIVDRGDSAWTRDDMPSVILTDDGTGQRLRIPTLMLAHAEGATLQHAATRDVVVSQLQWSLPQGETVMVDFWGESGNAVANNFIKDFANTAESLGADRLIFIPHFHVFSMGAGPGESDLCISNDMSTCSNAGVTPGGPVAGRVVLGENARQLCLLEQTAPASRRTSAIPATPEWWKYVREFTERCFPSPKTFTYGCSIEVMKSLGVNVEKIEECYSQRAGELLRKEKNNRAWSPLALRINGARFSGQLHPVQLTRAICSAFLTSPSACVDVKPSAAVTNHGVLHNLTFLAISGAMFLLGYTLYQRHVRKHMRAALRHEVMMEVRSQLQDYRNIDDGGRGKRPLIAMNVETP